MTYATRTFDLPELKGLSKKQIDVHLALYEGYVKHVNLILEKIQKLREEDAEANAFVMNELRRRLGFEFDGMRMHEYYFEQFEGGASVADAEGSLRKVATEKYGSWDGFIAHIKEVAGTRGIGWVIVYFDAKASTLHTAFVNDHELGQLAGLPIILAVDLWEHAYMVDYVPAEKKNYVEAFLENVNWATVDKRMTSV
ncbi:MAG: superoxide dismutase, Fe-Mn family [Parcubacteria bacterium C7867-004]|nr:MAG: superoxide dismutase, Fe-Mn family [Parcubacteria bacterium C7867-004]